MHPVEYLIISQTPTQRDILRSGAGRHRQASITMRRLTHVRKRARANNEIRDEKDAHAPKKIRTQRLQKQASENRDGKVTAWHNHSFERGC